MWILIIIGVVLLFCGARFLFATSKDTAYVKSQGGMIVMYREFINEFSEYSTVKNPIESSLNSLDISGSFMDCVGNRYRGSWNIHVQHTFNTIQVQYRAQVHLDGVAPIKENWDFPVGMNQKKMADIVKLKMAQVDAYGLHK